MALIDNEEAAKRLARVILSDIELYSRERPQEGETLASQIEQGRRLFGSRVTPAVVQLFDVVLADRHAANGKTAPAAAAATLPAAAPTIAPEQSLGDRPTPEAPIVAQTIDDQPTPTATATAAPTPTPTVTATATVTAAAMRTPTPLVTRHTQDDRPTRTPTPLVTTHTQDDRPTRTPTPLVAKRTQDDKPTPAVMMAAVTGPTEHRPSVSAPSTGALAREPTPRPIVLASADAPTPPAGLPVPVLTSRISVPKVLVVVAMVAAAVAVVLRYAF